MKKADDVPATAGAVSTKIKVSEAVEIFARCRAQRDGNTRLDVLSTGMLAKVGEEHGEPSLFPYVAVHEKGGSFHLAPTNEDDADKVRVHWRYGGRAAVLSLNRVWRIKKFTIDKGFALVMDCEPDELPDVGPTLALRFATARLEPVVHRDKAPAAGASSAGAS